MADSEKKIDYASRFSHFLRAADAAKDSYELRASMLKWMIDCSRDVVSNDAGAGTIWCTD